jgi:hypothetical protein
MVVGAAVVTVSTIVLGVSASVTTRVDSCVVIRVSVRVTASVIVVAGATLPVLPPSTATTEYDAGILRSKTWGIRGQAFVKSSSEESDTTIGADLVLISG